MNAHQPLFRLGQTVATPAALTALEDAAISPIDLISRHVQGDWGSIHPEDRGLNEEALEQGLRIFSVYPLPTGATVWVITEADRSVTTLLLPDDY